MPNKKRHPKLIRVNLVDDSNPVAATVTVQFNMQTKKITFPGNADVRVNLAGDNDIDFQLQTTGGQGGSASIAGVSFPGDQPGSGFEPSKVFGPVAGNISGTDPHVTERAYGEGDGGGGLTLTDKNATSRSSGTEEYEYRVWVRYQAPGTPPPPAEFYGSDPKIFNEPPPGADGVSY